MNKKELKFILQEGEGYLIEFKEKVANLDKEMVSFANGAGGRIFIGISDDNKIIGIKVTNKLKSQIQDIANNCEPPVKIFMEEYENILIVKVIQGDDKPYSCSSGFYTRIGPNAQKMSRDKIIEFFKSEGRIKFDELMNLKFDYKKDFDKNKLEHFLRLAKISQVLDVPSILLNLGVAEKQEGNVIFNNAGILFFAKDLSKFYRHAKITCALFKGTDKVHVLDRKDFNDDVVSNIDKAMLFLSQHIPVRYEFDGSPQRKEFYQVPLEALREAIINATCHRNYFEYGANIMVEVFDDRVTITNPGGLVPGLKKEDFGTISILRNPNIAALFHRIEYIEQMGTGINRMQKEVKEYGLVPIEFKFSTFLTASFSRKSEMWEKTKLTDQVSDPVTAPSDPVNRPSQPTQSTDPVINLLALLQTKEKSSSELRTELDLKHRQTFRENYLHPAMENGYIEYTIPEKPGSRLQKYKITEKGLNYLKRHKR
ncbi:MAG: putative DNA binding domain-containing protein [Spirochaetes bacterium]|nr:putative DNA binding domain-containing protein [Spirochaetota bacterium]